MHQIRHDQLNAFGYVQEKRRREFNNNKNHIKNRSNSISISCTVTGKQTNKPQAFHKLEYGHRECAFTLVAHRVRSMRLIKLSTGKTPFTTIHIWTQSENASCFTSIVFQFDELSEQNNKLIAHFSNTQYKSSRWCTHAPTISKQTNSSKILNVAIKKIEECQNRGKKSRLEKRNLKLDNWKGIFIRAVCCVPHTRARLRSGESQWNILFYRWKFVVRILFHSSNSSCVFFVARCIHFRFLILRLLCPFILVSYFTAFLCRCVFHFGNVLV